MHRGLERRIKHLVGQVDEGQGDWFHHVAFLVRPGLVAAGQLPGERRLMVEPRPVPEGRFVHLADEHLVEAAERVGNLVAEAMNVECALPSRRARVRLEEADWL